MSGIQMYHPADLFKERREKRAEEAAQKKTEQAASSEEVASGLPPKPKRPEGLGGILFDARDYLEKVASSFESMYSKFKELRVLEAESANPILDDEDRKKIHKKFSETRAQLDQMAKTIQVDGEPLFSGKFAQKPKVIQMGNTEEEVINLRFDPLTPLKLGIDRARVDSAVNTRKTTAQLDKAEKEMKEIQKYIATRAQNIESKWLKWDEANAEDTTKKKDNVKVNNEPAMTMKMVELKSKQEKAAAARGRTTGLLINIHY
jgi:flagellin-like hook-associated protein FlgL